MKEDVRLEQDILPDILGAEAAENRHLSSSAETFSLWQTNYFQANYFIETGKQLFNTDQVLALTNLIPESDPVAKQRILVHNLHKVANIAKRYTNRGLGLFDLVSEGTNGLIHAMEKFELEAGLGFPVYATKCICRNIERALMNQNNPSASFQGNL